MSFTTAFRSNALGVLDKLKKKDAEIAELQKAKGQYSKNYFSSMMEKAEGERSELIRAGRHEAQRQIDEFKKGLHERYAPDGEKLTADAALLTSGRALNADDLDGLMQKHAGNFTMQRLISEYAERNEIHTNHKFFSEAAKGMAADHLMSFYNSVVARPEFADLWEKPETFATLTEGELSGD